MRQNSPQKLLGISDFAQLGIGRLPAVSEQIDQYGLQQIKTLAIKFKSDNVAFGKIKRPAGEWLRASGVATARHGRSGLFEYHEHIIGGHFIIHLHFNLFYNAAFR